MATTGKLAEVIFEEYLETYQHQMQMLNLADIFKPEGGTLQNAGNYLWRPTQQHAPVLEGWDLTGQETDIIEQTYPAVLGTPKNDFIKQRADDLRDTQFWQRRARESGKRQATELNKQIAGTVANQGSLFFRDTTTNGFDFISNGQAILNERQGMETRRCFMLNDRDTRKFASELSGRETVRGRPEDAWMTGQIGSGVAGFDLFTGSFLPNLAGGASPDTTVTGAQSFAPEAGSVSATGVVTNVDYRSATIPVANSSGYNIGDKVKITNDPLGTPADIQSVGLADKTPTGQAMTFTVVAKPDGTSLTLYPKPIAADDSALTDLEKAYANVDTTIANGAEVARLNTDVTAKTNLFWDQDAIEVFAGTIPANFFGEFDGMKVITETMENGQEFYMVYDGNLADMSFRMRIFTWYGITMRDPSRAGVGIAATA